MSDNDKPFICNMCSMRFTNEDHLTVHRKKHEMSLNLGSGQKSNIFVADQTPTPTRFIRNCEEVGLFQDLQNVGLTNPFEEQFRKATEGTYRKQIGPSHSNLLGGEIDDMLHTPQVFPVIDTENSVTSTTKINSRLVPSMCPPPTILISPSTPPPVDDPIQPLSPKDQEKEPNKLAPFKPKYPRLGRKAMKRYAQLQATRNVMNKTKVPTILPAPPVTEADTVQLLLRIPDGRLVQLSALPVDQMADNDTPVCEPVTAPSNNNMALAKYKLKQTLTRNANSARLQRESRKPENHVPSASEADKSSVMAYSDNEMDTSPPTMQRGQIGMGDEPVEKRTKFLERNRAAASRCREKRKKWIVALEYKADELNYMNQQLLSEVSTLRAEVHTLKSLLLAHKDCPVTQAMQQQSDICESDAFLVPPREVTTRTNTTPITSKEKIILVNNFPMKVFPIIRSPEHSNTNRVLISQETFKNNVEVVRTSKRTVSVPIVSSTTGELTGLLPSASHLITLAVNSMTHSQPSACSMNITPAINLPLVASELRPTDECMDIIEEIESQDAEQV